MKINKVKDKVTDYDVDDSNPPLDTLWRKHKSNRYNADTSDGTDYDGDDLNLLLDAFCFEQESNHLNSDNSDNDISITMSTATVPNIRKTRKRDETSVTKPIPGEFITFASKLFNGLKDRLLEITETGSARSDLSVLQSSRNNSKPTLKLTTSEQAELRKVGHIYNNIFRDSSNRKVAPVYIADDVACSSEEDVSASYSLLHTRVEGKTNHLSIATATPNWKAFENYAKEKQKSIINTDVGFSRTKMDCDMERKKWMPLIESTGIKSMLCITKDSEERTLTDREMDNDKTKKPQSKRIICKQLKILQLEKDLETVNEFQKEVVKIGTSVSQNYSNRFFEKVVRSDLNDVIERDNKSAGDNFDILYNLIDNKRSSVVKVKDHDVTEHKRLSKTRQSIALSRTEKLSNIAKVQAALPTSTTTHSDDNNSFRVDKTLQFDNKSICKESLKEHSPLKETAIGETSHMRVPTDTQAILVDSNPELDLDKPSHSISTAAPKPYKSGSLRNLATIPDNLKVIDNSNSKPLRLQTHVHEPPMSKVLVFDQLNPLNNILLNPNCFTEVHKYNPLKAKEKLGNFKDNQQIDKHYDQACRVGTTREFEVRTMTIQKHGFVPCSAQETNQGIKKKRSKSYLVGADELVVETDGAKIYGHDKFRSNYNSIITKTKKQKSAPSTDKHKHHGSVDVTPKLQKKSLFKKKMESTSRVKTKSSLAPTKHEKRNSNQNTYTSKIRDIKAPKSKMTELGQNITVRQLKADYDYIGFNTGIDYNDEFKEKFFGGDFNVNAKSENVMTFSQSNISFSSSKNLNPMKKFLNPPCECLQQPSIQSMPIQEDWEPKLPTSKLPVFDYLNSLNNVLIPPFNATIAHKYNPMKSDKTFYCSKHNRSNKKYYDQTTGDFDMRTKTCKLHLAVPQVCIAQAENQGIRFSKLYSADIEKQATDINNTTNKLSDNSLHDHVCSNLRRNVTKHKKRTFSPTKVKHRHFSFAQATPKPVTKKQKFSNSPKVKMPVKLSSTVDSPYSQKPPKDGKKSIKKNTHAPKACNIKYVKTNVTKPERSVIVKQLIAECTGFDTGFKHDANINKNLNNNLNTDLNVKSKTFTALSQSNVTFDLTKNLNSVKEIVSTMTPESTVPGYQVGWPSELLPIKNDFDSGANVVAKIDKLPFMGSHECEWEPSVADTWSFRLLHGQLRLMARLAHRLGNATRTVVRGDTPVQNISVNIVRHDKKDLVAGMCLRFACETMRHAVRRALRSKCKASDIPPLLQQCANIVCVALRWKSAMYNAKQRLSFKLDSSGNISLKVANIPLRSVWKMTMHVGLILDNYSSLPCPRATNVRVVPIESDVLVPTVDMRRVLEGTPKDWGHAPATIWRVYRLLNHKRRDDNRS